MNHLLKRCFFVLLITIPALIFPRTVLAQVVINEFLPKASQEWVEFYNKGSVVEDLSNYFFDDDTDFTYDSGSSQKFQLAGLLTPQTTCYITLNSYLNDSGDFPSLFFLDTTLVDSYSYKDTTQDRSYSRIPDGGDWQTNSEPTKSSINCLNLVPTLTPTLTSTPTVVPTSVILSLTPTPVSYSNIYINEFIPDPESGNEKVEIKNGNSFSVNLVNWKIDDIENGGHGPKTFSAEISPSGLFTIDLEVNGFLNNDNDSVRLLDFNGVQKDKKDYPSSNKNKSWSKDRNGNWCERDSSFNSENSDCPSSTSAPTSTSTPVPSSTPKPTATPRLSVTPKPTLVGNTLSATTSAEEILGADSSKQPINKTKNDLSSENISNDINTNTRSSSGILPLLFIAPGTLMIGFALFMFIKNKHKIQNTIL